jgi:predicted nucleic acid-binding protein
VSGFLLDTNIPSELTRRAPSPALASWMEMNSGSGFYLSVISAGEFRKGLYLLAPGKRRTELENWFENSLLPLFGDRVLPVTRTIAERWGKLSAERQSGGAPMGTSDGLIAATALEHGLVLVTRNVRDFGGIGLDVLSPWELPNATSA